MNTEETNPARHSIGDPLIHFIPEKKMLNVLFLDWDGVVSSGGIHGTCRRRVNMISSIVEATQCGVVLTSHARRFPESLAAMERLLHDVGVPVMSRTPCYPEDVQITREDEIRTWLRAFRKGQNFCRVARMVILDDDPNDEFTDRLKPFLVRTDSTTGFTVAQLEEVISRFQEPLENYAALQQY